MVVFHIDMVTMVFALAAINLITALFALVNVGLSKSAAGMDFFILAKASQGLSWLGRIVAFDHPSPALASAADFLLLLGMSAEFILIAEFAQPGKGIHRSVLASLALTVGFFGGVVARCAPVLGAWVVFLVFAAMVVYSAAILFFAATASKFKRFIAVFYVTVQLGIAILYAVFTAEVGRPGLALSGGAIVYYSLLISMQLVGSFGYMLMASERDKAVLRDLASHDALTGCLNRRAFYGIVETLMANASRAGQEVAVVAADLDRFKHINDTWGHGAGDQMLQAFSAMVNRAIRKGDVSARFGGDEFVLMLPNCDRFAAEAVVERILADLRGHGLVVGKDRVACTASFGICTGVPKGPEDFSAMLALADEALYKAKALGRDRAESASWGRREALADRA